jgi:hypothetical protein
LSCETIAQKRFPFIKLQLLKENPCHIPNTHEWADVVRQHAPLFPRDLIDSMAYDLNGQLAPELLPCDGSQDAQLPAPCLATPAQPPPLPAATVLGVENGSIIAAETAIALRVFVHHARSIAQMCPVGDVVLALDAVKLSLPDVKDLEFSGFHKMHPNVTFYSFKLPLQPGNYSIVASITSDSCPDLMSAPSTPTSLTVVSNQQMQALQPQRVRMAVVDQITFNACTSAHEYGLCSGFTMHADLGYVGNPDHALWSRHVQRNDSVLFFYQHGINKAPLFPDSVLKVLIAMESRAAEEVMWNYIDSLPFNSHAPPFDIVLTHDRALLERAETSPFIFHTTFFSLTPLLILQQQRGLCASRSFVRRNAARCFCASRWRAAAAGRHRALSQNTHVVNGACCR